VIPYYARMSSRIAIRRRWWGGVSVTALGASGVLAACGPSEGGRASSASSAPRTAAAVSTHQAATSQVRIEGEAMAPPQRGDIVIAIPPDEPARGFDERIIGIPGDTIEIDGLYSEGGHIRTAVLIKPAEATTLRVLDEPYLPDQTTDPWNEMIFCCDSSGRATTRAQPFVIPPGQYFVMGDNRNRSRDSRFVGLIPQAKIQSKVLFVLSPAGRADIYSQVPSFGSG
jgi:signal peptidase I